MQKLPRLGKTLNKWWADPLLPKKGKYHAKKGSLTKKHKKALLNLRQDIFSRELWPTCQLQIITGIYMKVNTTFLVPGHQSEPTKSTKIIFIAFPMCKK